MRIKGNYEDTRYRVHRTAKQNPIMDDNRRRSRNGSSNNSTYNTSTVNDFEGLMNEEMEEIENKVVGKYIDTEFNKEVNNE